MSDREREEGMNGNQLPFISTFRNGISYRIRQLEREETIEELKRERESKEEKDIGKRGEVLKK